MQAKCFVLLNEAENKHLKKKSLQYTHTHTHKALITDRSVWCKELMHLPPRRFFGLIITI